jgi:hypothetical protein
MDALFGTLHLPDRPSTHYGLGGGRHMRLSFVAQLLHPIRRRAITVDE